MNHPDEIYMGRACELAMAGLNSTTPNPRVGCVLVNHGRVVGEGFHQLAGAAHAEVNALAGAEVTSGATAYVTLEPCNHQGRTGPCTQALIEAGVKEVVYGMQDPNPQVAGSGLAALREAGIVVRGPVLEARAKDLNLGFIKRMQSGLPWVRVKLAASLDGRTAMASGESQWITGDSARQDVQKWRARCCAIVTGVATVIDDDPALTVRDPQLGANPRQPLKVVVDTHARTPEGAQLLQGGNTVIATCAALAGVHYGAPVWPLPSLAGRVDLTALLVKLGQARCNEVLVEAGPTLAGAFVKAGLVDELVLYMAPKLLGTRARPLLSLAYDHLADAPDFDIVDCAQVGQDIRVILRPSG